MIKVFYHLERVFHWYKTDRFSSFSYQAVDLDELEEDTDAEESEEQGPPKKKLKKSTKGHVAVWSFKATTRTNAETKVAAINSKAFAVHFGKQSSEAAANRAEFSAKCRTLELSRISIELHQVRSSFSW